MRVEPPPTAEARRPTVVGVYLRRTYMPFKSFGSTLIFAGYCDPQIHLRWVSSEELVIKCRMEKKPDFLLTSYGGVKINYDAQSAKSANLAL
jgi:hypothetical protein